MEINEIKQRLTLATVLHHYNLKPDKNLRLLCPFHEDKTPSFQVYYKTHTGYCFSPKCKTHGKSLDVIDFIMYKEKISKHQAIIKAQEVAGIIEARPGDNSSFDRAGFLLSMFTYFKNAIHNSKPAREYIRQRGLDSEALEIGFNSGQFHHGTRKDEKLIQNCLELGLLIDTNKASRTGDKAYQPFGKYCIVFALRGRANQVTGLYFRSTINEGDSRHYYLKGRTGLYPRYPGPGTERLILTEAIIDAASLLQVPGITGQHEILSCYGTNGLTKEHVAAMKELKELKEIIFAFDADEAGDMATAKHGKELKDLFPGVKISKITLPTNEDVNSVYIAHSPDIFTHLLENRTELFFSNEPSTEPTGTTPPALVTTNNINRQSPGEKKKREVAQESPVAGGEVEGAGQQGEGDDSQLETSNPYKLHYKTGTASYYIQGGLSKVLDNMKVTLAIEHQGTHQKSRSKVDLYEDKQVEKLCKEASEKLGIRKDLLEADIQALADLLDKHRDKEFADKPGTGGGGAGEGPRPLTVQERLQVETFLTQGKLVYKINELLGKAGIAGEETNRIFLFVIATSYKMPEPLHALIQGSSGSGKTKLLRQISDCMPPEKVTRLTRVSDKGFYNYPENFLRNKLVSLEDIDGLGEEAEFAFRELQSNGELNSATSVKLESGQIVSGQKTVRGPIASLACTTRGEVYEDNMSRVFLIAVDESQEQTRRIIKYQNNKAAGLVDHKGEQSIKHFIQSMVREISPREVVNPFANQVQLPEEAHKIRRLNDLFQSFVKMVTVINQYQRKKDDKGRLVTGIEDIETAIDIMFESIVLKVDELDGSLRQFFEKLKAFVGKKGKAFEFTRFDVREATGLGKTQQHYYMNKLLELEYLQQYGFANRGFKYKIVYWDNYMAVREKIRAHLQSQVEKLKAVPTGKTREYQDKEKAGARTPANTSRTPGVQLRQASNH